MAKEDEAGAEATRKEMESLGIQPNDLEVVEPDETIPAETPEENPEEPSTPEEVSVEEPETPPERVARPSAKPIIPPDQYKEVKENLRKELQTDFDKKLEEMRAEFAKAKPNDEKVENLDETITELAKELELDPEKTRRLVEAARKGIEALTPEDKKLLEDFKADKARRETEDQEREQNQQFETEFAAILPDLKKQYPNASEEQLKNVKDKIDELAHSEKYAQTDLDYVIFKEKEEIGKVLFSPKKATFEAPRQGPVEENDEEWPEITADMTPNQILKAEKKREAIVERTGGHVDKVKITSRDGQERYE